MNAVFFPVSKPRYASIALRVTKAMHGLVFGDVHAGLAWSRHDKVLVDPTRRRVDVMDAAFLVIINGRLQVISAGLFEPVNPARAHLFPHIWMARGDAGAEPTRWAA